MSAADDAYRLLCLLVLEDGRRWGEVADPVQHEDARAVLAADEDPSRHWLGRARGYSKTTDVAAMTIAVMLVQASVGHRLYAAASDRDQARLISDAMAGFVARTDEIRGGMTVDMYRAATARTGVVLEILAADASSAWGLRPWWLVLDELCQWPETVNARKFHEALTSGLPKVPGSREIVMTSAGDPGHWSRREFETAEAEKDLWRVSSVEGPPPWIPPRLIEAERRRLPASAFARLWENRWSASEDRLFRAEDVMACATLEESLQPQAGGQYLVTVDVGWRNDATAICVSHAEWRPEGGHRVVVDRLEVLRAGRHGELDLTAIENRVAELARLYGAAVRCDPAQAIGMLQRWRARGIAAVEHRFSVGSNSQLALRLLELVREQRLLMPNDDELVDEFVNIRLVERGPGLYRIDHDPNRHDDQAVVVGMAAVHWFDVVATIADVGDVEYFDEETRSWGGDPWDRGWLGSGL